MAESGAARCRYLDTFLFDVKHLDSATHRTFTGAGNELILDNLRRLAAAGAPVIVRVPLIPGFNASAESLRAIGQFVAGLPESAYPARWISCPITPWAARSTPRWRSPTPGTATRA